MLSSDAVQLFLDDRQARNCRPASMTFYRYQLDRLLEVGPELPDNPAILRAILARVPGKPATRACTYRALRALYRWLLDQELIDKDPMAKVASPRVPRLEQRTLDRGEVVNLLDIDGDYLMARRDLAILTLLLDSGIRSGELRALRGRDIHDGYIRVEGKLRQRSVPIHAETALLLHNLARWPDDYVFRTVDDLPLCQQRLYKIVRKAIHRAGIDETEKSGPHCLRHTFGRHYSEADGPLTSLQKIMGHASISTTAIYTNLAKNEIVRDHAKFSQLTRTPPARLRAV